MLPLDVRFKPWRKETKMSDRLEATSWAVTECADADLGDLRRTQRVVQLAQRPGAARPEACGSGALRKAA